MTGLANADTRKARPLDAALLLRAAGLSVIPIKIDGTKAPALDKWKPYQATPAPDAAIRRWFRAQVGIAVITGRVSGDLEVLDFDDPAAFEAWREVVGRLGGDELLSQLVIVRTPGGYHAYYRCKIIEGNQKLAMRSKDEVLIETRGEGGYVLAPGSPPECHPDGKAYELLQGNLTNIPAISPGDRRLLHAAARQLDELKPAPPPARVISGPVSDGNRPGDDYNRRGSWAGLLETHGWKLKRTRGETQDWQRPGKDGPGTSATVNHDGSGLLHVFSSNADPFELDTAYSLFAAYALLDHGGDFKAAAKALTAQGYGEERMDFAGFVGAQAGTDPSANGEEWPEPCPLPDALLPVRPLPAALVPAPLAPWLEDLTWRMQCPLVFPAAGAIVGISAIVGRAVGIRPKRQDDWLEVPNLWGAVVGRTGIMKTPTLREALRPVYRLAKEAEARFIAAAKEHEFHAVMERAGKKDLEQRLADAVKKKNRKEMDALKAEFLREPAPPPIERRHVVNDSTVEKLGELLNQNPRGLLVFRDEVTGLLRSLDREDHSNDRAFYLEAWNGQNSYTYDRIGRGTLRIQAACISLLGGIQPGPLVEYLRGAVAGGKADDGLMQRFQLLVYPDVSGEWRNVDRWPERDARDRAFAIFSRLDKLEPTTIGATCEEGSEIPFLRFDGDAQEFFNVWREDLEHHLRRGEEAPALEGHLSKYRGLMPSLALLFHLIEFMDGRTESPAVSLKAAELAAAWCSYLESHARRVYGLVTRGHSALAAEVLRRIRRGDLTGPFVARDIYRNDWSGLTRPETVSETLELLEEFGYLRSEQAKAGAPGRPTTRYLINPRVMGGGNGQ